VGNRAGLGRLKISSPPGFDPRAFQGASNFYTDSATGPTAEIMNFEKMTVVSVRFQVIFLDKLYVFRGRNRVKIASEQYTVHFAAHIGLCRPGGHPTSLSNYVPVYIVI
jgi:hypothetical protein